MHIPSLFAQSVKHGANGIEDSAGKAPERSGNGHCLNGGLGRDGIDLMDAFGEIGLEYSLITVGSVSKENGPAYGSNAGEQFAQKMGEKNVVETNVETPNTGDSFNPMLVLAVAMVSLVGTAALVFKKKTA